MQIQAHANMFVCNYLTKHRLQKFYRIPGIYLSKEPIFLFLFVALIYFSEYRQIRMCVCGYFVFLISIEANIFGRITKIKRIY